MVCLKWNFGNSHLKLKSGGHVGDQAQKRVDFEVTRPIFPGARESPEIQPNLAVNICSICIPAPLLFSPFTLEYVIDGY